ncbi:MAG TPA: MotA/TolQ/ExbB proton channel family protein [Casimicrobiaceae bacterium]|nr:MotA/TolQ/ExbB proton channel family protein [Casimicrobiaceae bacterium]
MIVRKFLVGAALIAGSVTVANAAANLDELLEQTKNARAKEAQLNAQREQQFLADRNRQADLLAQAQREKAAEEARSKQLSAQFDANEKKLTELQQLLDAKGGNLGELFGVTRQVANDVSSVLFNSMISAQYPNRDDVITKMSKAKSLPSIDQLEALWFEMQREATETGRVVKFKTKVVTPKGEPEDAEVVRIGNFIASTNGDFLTYLPGVKSLAILSRQPEHHLRSLAEDAQDAKSGYVKTVLDPTRGVLLGLYVARPNLIERIQRGEAVGYIIILVGLIGAVLSLYQFLFLLRTRAAVKAQLQHVDSPTQDNPLGRVLASFKGDAAKAEENAEVVELRISEAVLKEVPPLERFQAFLRLAVAAGPLLGLIGTVVGMIITFQSITESGSSDPKLMAAGIGQAMIATVLGLTIAVPLLFVNAALTAMSRQIVQILDEQSTGLLAERLEKQRR